MISSKYAGPAVFARKISKRFGKLQVLKNLDIKIPNATTYCLLGPNGSGKTTFIRAIVGLIGLDGGDLRVFGEPVKGVAGLYSRIGYMTQHKALYPDLTLQENLEFFAGLYGIRGLAARKRIDELLDMVDLKPHRGRLAGDLSGGMYQRLSLACTLIHEPELLLLDEPTVGVDPRLRQTFWDYFNRLTSQGATILITTHLMDEAERCRLVGYMRDGRLEAQGSPDELKSLAGLKPDLQLWMQDESASYSAASLLADHGFSARVEEGAVRVELASESQAAEVLRLVKPLDLRMHEPTLSQAFLKLGEADR
ncbi:MAG: Trehalose/maltose import ATP-binding protein MalK [Methanosaeta sp. PtaB.Bin039]|nr:MAG: Trehalose/maltose import ATP-binding protein MalK [Methanosaeta sp. PtaB.Bin039]OPY44193.1 MAG: Trehalose/maltose import ATP-binding protein MalK [Methanosaeta sp. PtaU1.Bin028]